MFDQLLVEFVQAYFYVVYVKVQSKVQGLVKNEDAIYGIVCRNLWLKGTWWLIATLEAVWLGPVGTSFVKLAESRKRFEVKE